MFTDLLDRYLALKAAVQVDHGPVWEELQEVKKQLNDFVTKGGLENDN